MKEKQYVNLKKQPEKKIKFLLIGICLLGLLLAVGVKYTDKQTLNDYSSFNNTNIDGVIESVSSKHHRAAFKMTNNNSEFVFFPYTNDSLNHGHVFESFAVSGDKVSKPAYSDTLFLIKDKNIYKYTFMKPR